MKTFQDELRIIATWEASVIIKRLNEAGFSLGQRFWLEAMLRSRFNYNGGHLVKVKNKQLRERNDCGWNDTDWEMSDQLIKMLEESKTRKGTHLDKKR